MRRTTAGSFILLTTSMAFGGQAPADVPPGVVFHAGTQLIQISVIAQDKQGTPVAGLRRDEFKLMDNGVPQEIRLFLTETGNSNRAAAEPKTPNVFTNRIASSAGSPGGYSVILIDNLFTDSGFIADNEEGSGFGIARTLQMLRSIPIGERIAIYALGRKLDVICEFTSDRNLLAQQLRRWKPSADTPKVIQNIFAGAGEEDPTRGQSGFAKANAEAVSKAAEGSTRVDILNRSLTSEMELEQVADHLAGIPGRKNLIWLASRFVASPRALQKLSGANVAIYPVDVVGVCACPKPPCPNACPPRPKELMNAIAKQTGGVASYGRNDLDVAMREAMDDGSVSYTLGFYQSDDGHAIRIHQIAASVSRPGITLRYRTSYQTEEARPVVAKADLAQALNRPVDATAVSISASAIRAEDRLDLHAVVDAGSLELAQNRGHWTGSIEIVARFMAADGKPAGAVISQTLNLNLRQATYDSVLQQGIAYHNKLKIPPRAAELKLLFANPATGKIGTLTIPLPAIEPSVASSK